MRNVQKQTASLGVAQAREEFSSIIEQVQYQKDSYIISRHGKPAAAVVPVEVYENWKSQRKALFDTIRKVQKENKDAKPDKVMQDVLKAQQAVRSSK